MLIVKDKLMATETAPAATPESQPVDIPVPIQGLEKISGRAPIVVIGPNGAGKSRLMRKTTPWVQFVSAQRRTYLNDQLPSYAPKQATNEYQGQIKSAHREPWQASNEMDSLFAAFISEHFTALEENNDARRKGEGTNYVDSTLLAKLKDFWQAVFPGRTISFKEFTPVAHSTAGIETKPYPAKSMSDGERACLYMAARILKADPGYLVIDEPELHLHKKLAIDYWNTLEAMRPDVRFVYITHDLHFALSRKNPIFVVVQSESKVEIVQADAAQNELAELLLGAATLAINAKRIVFFEGVSGKGLAHELFKRWITGADTAAVGVGGRKEVIDAGSAFASLKIIANAEVISLIDRDHGPEVMLKALQKPAMVLALHEIESLFALPQVINAVAQHVHYSKGDPWAAFLSKARETLEQGIAKAVESRVRARIDYLLRTAFGNVTGGQTVQQVSTITQQAINQLDLPNKIPQFCTEEEKFIRDAMAKSDESILVVMSGKSAFKVAASVLGLKDDAYAQLVLGAIEEPKDPLNAVIVGAMAQYLPSRA